MNQQTPDRNCLSFWFPVIYDAGLPVPQTIVVEAAEDLTGLLDGEQPEGWATFGSQLHKAADRIGYPLFLRSGHTSGKHGWERTCYVEKADDLLAHVAAIVEYSHMVDLMGLPTHVWAVRKLIETEPLFTAFDGSMPITREFRVFARDGLVEHVQPYWPIDAIESPRAAGPVRVSIADALLPVAMGNSYVLEASDLNAVMTLAREASKAVGGYWSVDLLQDTDGKWWLTDMAEGDRSFRWEP